MRKLFLVLVLGLGAAALLGVLSAQDKGGPEWSLNATLIEACSCPHFCQCFFNTKPAGGHGHGSMEHFCRFNIAYQVNSGSFGEVKLDRIRFWVAGDLGSDFSEGKMDWAMLHFDPSVTPQQRSTLRPGCHSNVTCHVSSFSSLRLPRLYKPYNAQTENG